MMRRLSGMLAVAAAIVPVAAIAQDAGSGATAPAGEVADGGDAAEVVVTAQKRAERVQDVPISVVALDTQTLERANVTTVTDIQRLAPSLVIARAQNTTNQKITIRGVGTGSSTAIEPSVAFFLDGVYVPRAGSIVGNLVDIAAVEVLRGPQGTLFGRNASMGAISIRTADPSFERSASAMLTVGNYGRRRAEGMVNLPLGDTLALRLAGASDSYAGDFVALNPYPHRLGSLHTLFGRATLLFEPAKGVTWKLKGDYQTIDGDGQAPYELVPSTLPANNSFPARTDPDGAGPLTGPSLSTGAPYDRVISNYLFGRADDRVWGVTSDLSLALGDGGYTLRLVDGYRRWRSDPIEGDAIQTPLPLVRRNQFYDSSAQSHELQIISPERGLFGGAFDFVAGGYFYRERYAIDTVIDLMSAYCRPFIQNVLPGALAGCLAGPQTGAGADYFDQTTRSLAGFAQGTVHLGDRARIVLGGRYTDDRKRGGIIQVKNNAAEVFHSAETTSLAIDDDRFTWRAGAEFDAARDIMLFATYSTGFKSGGFNSSFSARPLGQSRVFRAETVKNYELGVRSQFLERAVTLNATLYRTVIDDLQDRGFDGLIFTTRNVGSLRQQGVEFDAVVRPAAALSLGVAGAYLDSRYLDFRNAPNLPAFPGTQDLTGTRANFSPRWQGNAYAEWSARTAGGWGVLARTDLRFQSRVNLGSDSNNNPDSIQPAYELLGARVALTTPDRRFEFALFGNNLTDAGFCIQRGTQTAESLLGVRNPATGGTALRCVLGAPRTYGLQVRMNWR